VNTYPFDSTEVVGFTGARVAAGFDVVRMRERALLAYEGLARRAWSPGQQRRDVATRQRRFGGDQRAGAEAHEDDGAILAPDALCEIDRLMDAPHPRAHAVRILVRACRVAGAVVVEAQNDGACAACELSCGILQGEIGQ
jgi:hypothetical protein